MMNEQLSAWIDGELHGVDSSRAFETVSRNSAQREACALFWLIGDVMRKERPLSSDFTSRVLASLESEPIVFAPKPRRREELRPVTRWMPMAAAAAGAAVAVWMGTSLWNDPARDVQMIAQRAASPALVAAASLSNKNLSGDRSYLMAHQAFTSMGVPMAGVAQYIRTVSDDHQVSAR
jgi:sigma-E factor negative regulatory protein RseA